MTPSYMTSASFNQNPSKARQAANQNPPGIADHGKPTHVPLTYAEFEAKWAKPKSLAEALYDPDGSDQDFDPPRWLNSNLLVDFRDRILLLFDTTIALRTGALPTLHKRPSSGAMIAGTALHHGLTVVTRNVADFESLACPAST